MSEEIEDKILDNALGPVSVSNESGSATGHTIDSQIRADKYRRAIKSVASNPMRGIAGLKIAPPGGSDVDFRDNNCP